MATESRLLPAVRGILFEKWDPIGVNDSELCRNEYDSYASALVRLLLDGADEFKLAARLSEFKRVSMGMSAIDEELDREVARRLLALIDGAEVNWRAT